MFRFNPMILFLLLVVGELAFTSPVSISKSPAKVFIGETRDGDKFLKVDIHADGEVYNLRLTPIKEDIWVDGPKIFSLKGDENGNPYLEEVDLSEVSKTFRMYEDAEATAVIGIDGQKVTGYIGHLLTVKNEGDKHYIYRSDEPDVNGFANDYLTPPDSIISDFSTDANFENETTPTIIDRQIRLGTIIVEVLAVIDLAQSTLIGDDLQIFYHQYAMWVAVNQRYGSVLSPTKFSIKLVANIVVRNAFYEPYVQANIISGNKVSQNVLISFGKWAGELYNINFLYKHDVLYLQTGRDMVTLSGSSSLLGITWPGCACPKKGERYSDGSLFSYATGVGEDRNSAYAVNVAAHEVGHNLGAPHDGDSGATTCPASDHYIMAPIASLNYANSNKFSTCSAYRMNAFSLTSRGLYCLFS